MIINVTKDKSSYRINQDFARAVPEFCSVLDDERLGVIWLVYIIYSLDMADDNIYQNLPDDIRKSEVAESLQIDKTLLKDSKVLSAWNKYKSFVNSNIGYKFKEAHNSGMNKLADFVKDKKKLTDDDAKEFSAVLKEMPMILEGKNKIEKLQTKESAKGRVTAGRQLTVNEKN